MKNLLLVANYYAVKEKSEKIKIEHILRSARATVFDEDTKLFKSLSKYADENTLKELGKGFLYSEIEKEASFMSFLPVLEESSKVKLIINDLTLDKKYSVKNKNIVFFNKEEKQKKLSNNDTKNNMEDEILDLFSQKLKKLKNNLNNSTIENENLNNTLDFKEEVVFEEEVKLDRITQAKELKIHLEKKIFGQDMAINSVFDAVKNNIVDNTKQPKHTFLFLGPPGVGKTYLSILMTETLEGYVDYKTFDMSQFQHEGDGISLYGTSRNYGNGKVGSLTSFVKDNPKSIIILDEFEKAHNNIQDGLLSIFSGGYLTDANGWCPAGKPYDSKRKACEEKDIIDKIDFTNTIVVITSNLGSELYNDVRFLDLLRENHSLAENMIFDVLSREIKKDGKQSVPAVTAPMVSRLSQSHVALFNKLKLDNVLKIVKNSFNEYKNAFEEEYNLKISTKLDKNFFKILTLNYAPNLDIRRIKSKSARMFFDKITDYIIDNDISFNDIDKIKVSLSKDVIAFIKKEILSLEKKDILERDLTLKNLTLKYEFSIKHNKSDLSFNIDKLYLERVKRIKDFQGESALSIALPDKSFKDIAGHERAKVRLKEIVNLLKNKDKIKKFNIKVPKGVLLYGPPGTGKTMLASAIAKEAGLPFISTTANDLINTPNLIKDIFKKANEYAPCLVFIDEIDAFRKRGTSAHNESFFAPKVNELLTNLDGANSSEDVFVVAATNRKEIIDDAILRAGRIDIHININNLDKKAREYFFRDIILKESKINVDMNRLLLYSTGMNGSQLQKLKRESYLYVIRNDLDDITEEILIEQINIIKYGERSSSRTIIDMLEETAYHEAGHAVISQVLFPQRKIEQITITPREKSLGFVAFDGDEPQINMSIEDIKNQICVALAGRLSQVNKFGSNEGTDTGAIDDLKKATLLTYNAIKYYGMSEDIRHVNLSEIDTELFKDDIEENIKNWLIEAETKTNTLIEDNWNLIELLSSELLEKELVDGDFVVNMLKG